MAPTAAVHSSPPLLCAAAASASAVLFRAASCSVCASACLTGLPPGSFVSGLYTPIGDLDLSIEGQASWWVGYAEQLSIDRVPGPGAVDLVSWSLLSALPSTARPPAPAHPALPACLLLLPPLLGGPPCQA